MNIDFKILSVWREKLADFLKNRYFWIIVVAIVVIFVMQYSWFLRIEDMIKVQISAPTPDGQRLDQEGIEKIILYVETIKSGSTTLSNYQRDPFATSQLESPSTKTAPTSSPIKTMEGKSPSAVPEKNKVNLVN